MSDWVPFAPRPELAMPRARDLLSVGQGAAGAKTLGALGGRLNCRIMDDSSEVRVED